MKEQRCEGAEEQRSGGAKGGEERRSGRGTKMVERAKGAEGAEKEKGR